MLTPFARLQLVPGYRIDRVDGQLHDVLAGSVAPTYDYGTIKQPKFSASYRVGGQSSVYANWGRTFQIGSGDGAYRRQSGDLGPSINDGWETGFKFAPSTLVDGRLAYWEQRASGEVATVLGVNGVVGIGAVANVGRTLRRGWDAQLNLQPAEHWRAWVSYSRQKAMIATPDPSAPATRGKEIENVPHWLATAGLEWQLSSAVQLSAWGNAQGDYYLERTNTLGRAGGDALLNLARAGMWMRATRSACSCAMSPIVRMCTPGTTAAPPAIRPAMGVRCRCRGIGASDACNDGRQWRRRGTPR